MTRAFLILTALLLSAPVWADGPLEEGATSADYNAAGRGINDALGEISKAFEHRLVQLLDPVIAPRVGSVPGWELGPSVEYGPIRVASVRAAEGPGKGRDALVDWWQDRWSTFEVDAVALKLLSIDSVGPRRVRARVRYEAVGTTSD